ncbi:MAG: hypothetical protein ABEJ92_00215 [Halobacteriales archaeon]
MTFAAVCADCGWSFRDDYHEAVTERLERHARKEQHHVEFTREAEPAAA